MMYIYYIYITSYNRSDGEVIDFKSIHLGNYDMKSITKTTKLY